MTLIPVSCTEAKQSHGLSRHARVSVSVSAVGELEQRTKEKMEAAKKRTSQEITELKDKLKASRENINHLKAEIRKLEEDGDHKDH